MSPKHIKMDLVEVRIISYCCSNVRCIIYTTVSVSSPGYAGYKLCYQEVLKVVKGIIHQPYELEDSNVFYAFSYYFDRAVDAGLIG